MSDFRNQENMNFANDSYVGFQAQFVQEASVIHEQNNYQVSPNDPPEKQFKVGVAYLDGGMPGRALELIEKAVVAGHVRSEVGFHWLLAFFSGRTIHQLTEDEVARLVAARGWLDLGGADAWAEGLRAIDRLLREPDNRELGLKEFGQLGAVQRDKILRHLELLLGGRVRDALWNKACAHAEEEQVAHERINRVWMFFEPKPAGPRRLSPARARLSLLESVLAVLAAAVFVASTAYLAVLAAEANLIATTVAVGISVLGGYNCRQAGVEWRFRAERLRFMESRFVPRPKHPPSGLPGGFVRQVDHDFDYYFAKYRPAEFELAEWTYLTSGFRDAARDEVVELYREQPVAARAIRWLVRARASDMASAWRRRELHSYRSELKTPVRTGATLVIGVAALSLGYLWTVTGAVQSRPFAAFPMTGLAVVTGAFAATRWFADAVEERRVAADADYCEKQFRRDEAAFGRWAQKLAQCPSDQQMADWLDCDRKVLMQTGLKHYRLLPSQVIAHAFIEGRAKSSGKRARVRHGTWRYSRYSIRIFLLTNDGVRQMAAEVDFEHATYHRKQRTNYRFDAIASVRVTESDRHRQTFELTLFNGEPITEEVVGAQAEKPGVGAATWSGPGLVAPQYEEPDADDASRMTLDAAGLNNTLHVLEGIAAEGKEWAAHERSRGEHRIGALRALFDTASR